MLHDTFSACFQVSQFLVSFKIPNTFELFFCWSLFNQFLCWLSLVSRSAVASNRKPSLWVSASADLRFFFFFHFSVYSSQNWSRKGNQVQCVWLFARVAKTRTTPTTPNSSLCLLWLSFFLLLLLFYHYVAQLRRLANFSPALQSPSRLELCLTVQKIAGTCYMCYIFLLAISGPKGGEKFLFPRTYAWECLRKSVTHVSPVSQCDSTESRSPALACLEEE